jgi:hypothetical protein
MILLTLALVLAAGASDGGLLPLKLENDFASPTQVVEYFVRRDLQGAYLGGLGERERKEYTLWRRTYPHELFFVAKSHKISAPKRGRVANLVRIEVTYEIVDYRDTMGAHVPVKTGPMVRTFSLQRDEKKRWRILAPFPKQAVPVLSEAMLREPSPKRGSRPAATAGAKASSSPRSRY